MLTLTVGGNQEIRLKTEQKILDEPGNNNENKMTLIIMSKFWLFVNAYILNTCFPGLQNLEHVWIRYNGYLLFLYKLYLQRYALSNKNIVYMKVMIWKWIMWYRFEEGSLLSCLFIQRRWALKARLSGKHHKFERS